jgi:hypothetical protein
MTRTAFVVRTPLRSQRDHAGGTVQPTSGVNQNAVDIPRRRAETPPRDASI